MRVDGILPAQLEFTIRKYVDFNPGVDSNINMIDKGWEVPNDIRMVHEKFNVPIWGFSNRSIVLCYHYMSGQDKFESIGSSEGNEAYFEKWNEEGLFGSDVIAEYKLGYWRIEPYTDPDSGEVTGSKVLNMTMFDPKGYIPRIIIDFIVKTANNSIRTLVKVAKEHEDEYQKTVSKE